MVDDKGFVRVDGVCLGKLTPDGKGIEFVDKNPHRSQVRGSRYVIVQIGELTKLGQSK